MIYTLVTAPTIRPISINDAKDYVKTSGTADDARIQGFIDAAISYVENFTGLSLITQTWDLYIDYFPWGQITIPKAPLQSVTSITYADSDNSTQTLGTSTYTVDTDNIPGRIYLAYNKSWPGTVIKPKAVKVRFVSGYGDDGGSVPEPIRQALLLKVQMLYEQPINYDENAISNAIDSLLNCYRVNYNL